MRVVVRGHEGLAQGLRDTGFDAVTTTKSIGNSTYHALQSKLERRVGKGLSILGAYTWSKSLSNADTSSVGGGTYLGGLQDYNDLRGNRSVSAFDVAQRLSMAGIYDVPLKGFLGGVVVPAVRIDGWTFTGGTEH